MSETATTERPSETAMRLADEEAVVDGAEQAKAQGTPAARKSGSNKKAGSGGKKPKAAAKKAPKPKEPWEDDAAIKKARAAMKRNEAAYLAYQEERDKKGTERAANPHRDGYKAFKAAYRDFLARRKELAPKAK